MAGLYGTGGGVRTSNGKPTVNNGFNPLALGKAMTGMAAASSPWPFNEIFKGFAKPADRTVTSPPPTVSNFINGNGTKGFSTNLLDSPALGRNTGGGPTNRYGGHIPSAVEEPDTGSGRMSLAEAMAQITPLLESMGVSNGGVSYDPLRNQARSQWTDADARTKAMYDQLQSSIGNERGNINTIYDQGVTNTNEATKFANDQQVDSLRDINAMQSQQAKALGIEEAVANTVNSGNYAVNDAAGRTADTNARGQITTNQMNTDRATGLTGISNLVGAAGLQGVMDRQTRSNELARLLAQYDVDESKANQESSSNYQKQMLSGVFDLMGMNRDDYEQDSNDEWHAQQELNKWDIANLPGQSMTGKPAPVDSKTAMDVVTGLYGKDAFKSVQYQKLAKELYLKLQGY